METQQPQTIGEVVRKASQDARAKATEAVTEQPAQTKVDLAKGSILKGFADDNIVVGIGASISPDKAGDAVERAALRKMAHEFCTSKAQLLCANHDEKLTLDGTTRGYWIGAPVTRKGRMILPGEELPDAGSDDPIVAINFEKGNDTHWFFELLPTDPKLVEAFNNGEINGFSWGGNAVIGE